MDLMLMFDLNETTNHLPMTSNVCRYGHVLKIGGSHVLRRMLEFVVEGQSKKGRSERTWKREIEKISWLVRAGKMHFANRSALFLRQ